MTRIKALRILPPFAIGRLGSADEPMDNYAIEIDPPPASAKEPLGYRALEPLRTLIVGERSGEIEAVKEPPFPLEFKRNGKIRPVAPFLEVFALTEDDELAPLTVPLLKENGFHVGDVSWAVTVANRKVARRTGDENDVVTTGRIENNKVEAGEIVIDDHDVHTLHGYCNNFVDRGSIVFGEARFIKPNESHPQIRLRFTPARGLIYGPRRKPGQEAAARLVEDGEIVNPHDQLFEIPDGRDVYDPDKGGIWFGYNDVSDEPASGKDDDDNAKAWKQRRNAIWAANGWDVGYDNETVPPALFAIDPPAPSWLYDNVAISRGYLDDACDGFVEVRLARPGEDPKSLNATARICSAPPAMAPDSLFVRTLADDLDQAVFGPLVPDAESTEVTRVRAQDVVRRAFETVRFMNVAVMNGNDYRGRSALSLDSMPEEEAADTERAIRPVMHPGTVDTKAVTALHQQAYAALLAGTAPWFTRILRNPLKVADFTDHGRRKMPALMCGADNNYLALTWRQIHTIRKAASDPPPSASVRSWPESLSLSPRNLTAHRHAAIHYEASGNPISSRPITSVANCCPGLEVDFRAVWRRLFKGIELREHDNLVVRLDPDCDAETLAKVKGLQGRRLLRVQLPDGILIRTTTPIKGPAPSDPDGYILLTTDMNPHGLAPLEWSNALAYVLPHHGERLRCDFTKDAWAEHQLPIEAEQGEPATPANYESVFLEVRPFFEDDTAVISRALAKAGELTQGLCSPWQNDYRECSCYYWASARPDFVNVHTDADGLSAGDNWFQRKRTGSYVPDDYADSRLVMYDELFREWERALKFQIKGRDSKERPAP